MEEISAHQRLSSVDRLVPQGASNAEKGAGKMTGRSNSMSALPPVAEAEILTVLSAKMRISSDEIAAILEKHGVSGDIDALQDRYRKQLGQRLMAGIRDASGKRQVLSAGQEYVVVECCNDRQKLQKIQHRLQAQMNGLNISTVKVRGRVRVLGRLSRQLKKAG